MRVYDHSNGVVTEAIPSLDAYFTKLTEGQLRTIDDIPELRDLVVPEGSFRSARTSKAGKKGEASKSSSSTTKRTFAPFPSNYRAHQAHPSPSPQDAQLGSSMFAGPSQPTSWPVASTLADRPQYALPVPMPPSVSGRASGLSYVPYPQAQL